MNQKLEDLLQLAIQTPEATRSRTEDLNVGFQQEDRTWELIVKYHGSLDALRTSGIEVEYLIAGYAILTVPESLVEAVAAVEEIEYVEKPKRYFYQATNPVTDSCIVQVTGRDLFLTGKGVLIAVLDSGISYRLPVFRKEDGSTRIKALWDQTLEAESSPQSGQDGREGGERARQAGQGVRQAGPGVRRGREFSEEQINAALAAPTRQQALDIVPTRDVSGHGTAVAGIAAGCSAEADERYQGVACEADLLVVKLGLQNPQSFPRTTEIMRGVTWALAKAQELGMPMVINLSLGNSYGAHDGSSLIERFLDNAAEIGRTVICVGSGNEGASDGHIAGNVEMGEEAEIELAVAEYESSLSVQLWKNYADRYRIVLRSPRGDEEILPDTVAGGKYTIFLEETEILIYIGEPTPYAAAQEIYFDLIPDSDNFFIGSGIWTFRLVPIELVTGNFYFYLPSAAARNAGTGFFASSPEVTLTIPSTAGKVITVGAYNSVYDAYAEFSGRGYANAQRTIGVVTAGFAKPDLVAPGVEVLAPNLFGGYMPFTGTSFATPIVSGAAALLMEWGIVRGNDPYLYGEKVKAYLRKGAVSLRGEEAYPNARIGWGALCVSRSLP